MPQPLSNFGAAVTGGYIPHAITTVQSLGSVNATLMLARPGIISQISLSNHDASHSFIKFYDKATAPVVGTDIPLTTLLIPTKGIIIITLPFGLNFIKGIGYGLTKGPEVANTTAVGADSIVGFITYV